MVIKFIAASMVLIVACAQRKTDMTGGSQRGADVSAVMVEQNQSPASSKAYDLSHSTLGKSKPVSAISDLPLVSSDPQRPQTLQDSDRSLASSVSSAEPSDARETIRTELEVLLPLFVNSTIEKLLPTIESAVNNSVSHALSTLIQTAVNTAVKSVLPEGVQFDLFSSSSNTITSSTPSPVCPSSCQPQWLTMVTRFTGSINSYTHPMCEFKTMFPECGGEDPNSNCSSSSGVATCCPLQCLPDVNVCFQGTTIQSVCINEGFKFSGNMLGGWANTFLSMG